MSKINFKTKHNNKRQGRGDVTPLPISSIANLSNKQLSMIKDTVVAIVRCKTKKQACSELGISEQALYKRLSIYPQIRSEIEKINKTTVEFARSSIMSSAEESANSIIKLMRDANSENVKLQASTEILDRVGIIKPQSQNNVQVNVLNQLRKDKEDFGL